MTKRTPPFSSEVRERAVRMVEEHTYVATWSGLVYAAFVVDAFTRRIVG